MLETLLLWVYMLLVCLTAGTVALALLRRILDTPGPSDLGPASCVMAGVTVLTVYAEYFSIFAGVGAAAHILMLALVVSGAFLCRYEIRKSFTRLLRVLRSPEWLIILALTIALAFYTSRGSFHTDTGIYHAQAIRLIEEYGCLIGSGNIQQHFAYNSSSLCFAALFTFSWLFPGTAFHGTTGFLMTVLGIYAVHGLLTVRRTRAFGAAGCDAAILLYILTNAVYAMSPATDFAAMLNVLFLFSEWLRGPRQNSEETAGVPAAAVKRESIVRSRAGYYGLLSVYAIFIVSLKLSAAPVVLLAFLPLVLLIRERQPKRILLFVCTGFLAFLPYLIRNVILSGWLLYPVETIDLFRVDWKIPREYLETDAAQISVWGKCLYDVSKKDWPLRQWFSVWLAAQEHYALMLLGAQLPAAALLIINALYRSSHGMRIGWDRVIFYIALFLSLAVWFLEAPFIRYGLAYLLAFPLITAFEFCGMTARQVFPPAESRSRAGSIPLTLGYLLCAGMLVCSASWIDHYAMDDLVFAKQHLADPYYLTQKPFDHPQEESEDLNGITVYYSVDGEINSYWVTPSTCYRQMLDRSEARGSTIRQGFRAK